MPETLSLLVIGDPHYVNHAGAECSVPSLFGRHALEWTRRAVEEARRLQPPDVIVLMGDIVDNGLAPGADRDIVQFVKALRLEEIPVIVVPGNHDRDPAALLALFADHTGPHHIKGYTLYTFADHYGPGDLTTRPTDSLRAFLACPKTGPVIALQHNPIYPPVEGDTDSPYMPTNTDDIIAAYEQAGVTLSISGHYHKDQDPAVRNGVTYLIAGSLVETPFPFYLIQLRGNDVRTDRRQLQIPSGLTLVDAHVHTHFGYCAVDVHPEPVAERAAILGLSRVICVEHAGQLYLPPEGFWGKRHIEEPDAIRRARDHGRDRIAAYRTAMSRFRSDSLRVGLEVEVDRNGNLTLLEEDRRGWDRLIGGVHWLPDHLPTKTPAQFAQSFMRVTEQLVATSIDVLAHPFRIFHQRKLARPRQLYRPVAALLSKHAVAAEVNFHNNQPDPDFFRCCAQQGVRIVPGSDAHNLREVGDLHPHLRLLEEIGLPLTSSPT